MAEACIISNMFYLYLFFNFIFILLMGYVGYRISSRNAVMIFLVQTMAILFVLILSYLFMDIMGVVL